jgi:hypothetical protein
MKVFNNVHGMWSFSCYNDNTFFYYTSQWDIKLKGVFFLLQRSHHRDEHFNVRVWSNDILCQSLDMLFLGLGFGPKDLFKFLGICQNNCNAFCFWLHFTCLNTMASQVTSSAQRKSIKEKDPTSLECGQLIVLESS